MRIHDFLLTQEVRCFRARHRTSVVNNMLLAAANVAACVSDPAGHVTAMLNRDLGKPEARNVNAFLTPLSVSLVEKLT
jgi:hypothetical protein